MDNQPLDKIYIRDLGLRCILGVYEDERRAKQDIIVNITLHVNLRKACTSDCMDDTVDYKTIKNWIVEMVESSGFYLVERLAQAIADLCLESEKVQRADVTVDKPGALRYARSVAVEISRERGDA
jgi:D-erythro-7,8-dihydroneopterin triphosphate epimerase